MCSATFIGIYSSIALGYWYSLADVAYWYLSLAYWYNLLIQPIEKFIAHDDVEIDKARRIGPKNA